jgi:DNA repair exonuclease SbcCD ATPase subunit
MKLLGLTLENFKGHRLFDFNPEGSSMDVFGANGAGKTTIADAYFWLLFGQNFDGKTNFRLLPEDAENHIIEGLTASVTGRFLNNDGKEITLQRSCKQNFSHKKGEAERSVVSNSTDFFVNGVPKLKKDYTAFVAGMCDDQTFQILTDPDKFAGKMSDKDRREVLIRLFAVNMDDRSIINAHANLQPLIHYLGFKSVDDYTAQTKYERQKIQKQKDEIPGRIDEAEKAKPADMPEPGDGPAMLNLQKQKIQLEQQISAIRNGEAASDIRRQISDIQAKMADAEATYTRKNAGGNASVNAEAFDVRSKVNETQSKINYLEKVILPDCVSRITGLNSTIQELRQKWVDEDASEFDSSATVCPVCGREFQPEKKQQIEDDFLAKKDKKLDQLEAEADAKKAELAEAEKDLKAKKQELEKGKSESERLHGRLAELEKQYVAPVSFSSTPEYSDLRKQIANASAQLTSITQAADQRISALQEQLYNITGELNAIQRRAGNKQIVEQQDKRIADLKKQESELSQLLATYDKGLALAEQFTQQKALDIEAKVNSAFQIVKWKLFDIQNNGGICPCCEATVDGHEYNDGLNSAAKLNAGLDIINTLSRMFGVSVPLWIDNAESVTDYLPVDTQVFRLYVSAADKKLRVEERA